MRYVLHARVHFEVPAEFWADGPPEIDITVTLPDGTEAPNTVIDDCARYVDFFLRPTEVVR